MKLVIQIPCYNEEATIAATIAALPKKISGIDEIDIIVIDDGCTDSTSDVAHLAGVSEVVRLNTHIGLASAFLAGVKTAIRRNADILVNTDADHQYPGHFIADLVAPIVSSRADVVIGNRLSAYPPPFSFVKMFFERLGSRFVSIAAGINVADAASGFRAFNRATLLALFIHGRFSYTLESIVFAGMRNLRVLSVPITVNPKVRPSRLFRSIPHYINQSVITVLRAYLMYHPLRFFANLGFVCSVPALFLGIRYLYFFALGKGAGHIQSLILMTIFITLAFLCFVVGLLGDVIAANRRLLEEIRYELLTKKVI
jgi:glycosyltransferase involved in cell wall biosynthesis